MQKKLKASKQRDLVKVFKNQYVQITLKMNVQKSEYRDGVGTDLVHPVTISGYIIGQDGQSIFLGENNKREITSSINKEMYGIIEIIGPPKDHYDEILDSFKDDGVMN